MHTFETSKFYERQNTHGHTAMKQQISNVFVRNNPPINCVFVHFSTWIVRKCYYTDWINSCTSHAFIQHLTIFYLYLCRLIIRRWLISWILAFLSPKREKKSTVTTMNACTCVTILIIDSWFCSAADAWHHFIWPKILFMYVNEINFAHKCDNFSQIIIIRDQRSMLSGHKWNRYFLFCFGNEISQTWVECLRDHLRKV